MVLLFLDRYHVSWGYYVLDEHGNAHNFRHFVMWQAKKISNSCSLSKTVKVRFERE